MSSKLFFLFSFSNIQHTVNKITFFTHPPRRLEEYYSRAIPTRSAELVGSIPNISSHASVAISSA